MNNNTSQLIAPQASRPNFRHQALINGCLNWIVNSIGMEIVKCLNVHFHKFDGQLGQVRLFQESLHHLCSYNPSIHEECFITLDREKLRESLDSIITSYLLGVIDLKNSKLGPDSTKIYTLVSFSIDSNETTAILFQYYQKLARTIYCNVKTYLIECKDCFKLCHQCIQEVILDYVFDRKMIQLVEKDTPLLPPVIKEEEERKPSPPLVPHMEMRDHNGEYEQSGIYEPKENEQSEPEGDLVIKPHDTIYQSSEYQRASEGSEASEASDGTDNEGDNMSSRSLTNQMTNLRPDLLQFGLPFLHKENASPKHVRKEPQRKKNSNNTNNGSKKKGPSRGESKKTKSTK